VPERTFLDAILPSDPARLPQICSLLWATDLDVLPLDGIIARREGHWVVRSPGNPDHYWGNFLLFDKPPAPGDFTGWEARFASELGGAPHRAFGWHRRAHEPGASGEFLKLGYTSEQTVGLVASPTQLSHPARANRDVAVRVLRPTAGEDEALWEQVGELQVAGSDGTVSTDAHRRFHSVRQDDLRRLFARGRGAWYVALDGDQVVGSCGIVVTGSRARFQTVDTAESHRRRGICSRLLVDAAAHTAGEHATEQLVIAADPGYHAIGLYEDLGFRRFEAVCALLRRPGRED
jgi:ribosomal protein S18 acetylase RimI-like enzyme